MAGDPTVLGRTNAGINEQLMTAQQQLALAQALRGQALQPIQAPAGQNGRISPLSVLAQALNGYNSKGMMDDATHNLAAAQAAQAQNQWGYMKAAADSMADAAGGGGGAPTQPVPGTPVADAPLTSTPQASTPSPSTQALAGALQGGDQSSQTTAPSATSPSPAALGSALQGSGSSPDMRRLLSAASLNAQLGQEATAKFGYDMAGKIFGRQLDRTTPELTEPEKFMLSQGIHPGSTAWNEGMQKVRDKANYIAPVQVAQGNVALNPITNKPMLQNPKMADGMSADFTDPLKPTASAMPGYAKGNATNVKAAETAKADADIRDVTLPNGATVPVRAGPAAAAGGAQAGIGATWTGGQLSPQALANLQTAAAKGNPDAKAALTAYQQAQPRLGQTQSDKLLTDQGTQMYTRINTENTNNAQHRQILNEMYRLAQSGSFGPGSAGMARVKAMANNAGIDISGAQTDQDVMKKLSSNMIMSQLGQGGTGTDAQMSTLQSAFPNGEMTNDAMKKVIPMLVSQIDAREARAKVANQFVAGGGQLSQLPSYLSKFNAVADPGTVSLGRQMAEASQNGTVGQVVANLKQSRPKDWQQLLNRVHQLDQMGAF